MRLNMARCDRGPSTSSGQIPGRVDQTSSMTPSEFVLKSSGITHLIMISGTLEFQHRSLYLNIHLTHGIWYKTDPSYVRCDLEGCLFCVDATG